jgi:preprotein translocase subunit SecG
MNTFSIFLVLITIVCFLLIIVIMVQNPKGGGLSSTLGGSTQMGGVQKTTDFLDKSTWTLATILVVLIIFSSLSFSGGLSDTNSKIIDETETATPAATKKTTETAKPATTTPVQTAPATPVEDTKK